MKRQSKRTKHNRKHIKRKISKRRTKRQSGGFKLFGRRKSQLANPNQVAKKSRGFWRRRSKNAVDGQKTRKRGLGFSDWFLFGSSSRMI